MDTGKLSGIEFVGKKGPFKANLVIDKKKKATKLDFGESDSGTQKTAKKAGIASPKVDSSFFQGLSPEKVCVVG